MGEDPFLEAQYAYQIVTAFQGGVGPTRHMKSIITCKHMAGYDLEDWEGISRHTFDAIISPQDLAEFYMPAFQTCLRDARGVSALCSYNALNGVPMCANSFILQDVLRDTYKLDGYVITDCGAVADIWMARNYTTTFVNASAVALNAGSDLCCGVEYGLTLQDALDGNMTTVDTLRTSVMRIFGSLIR